MNYLVAYLRHRDLECFESSSILRLGSRVLVYRKGLHKGVVVGECGTPIGMILGKLPFGLDKKRIRLSETLSKLYGYPISEYISLHFPSGLDDYEKLLVVPTSPLSALNEIPLNDFLTEKGARELVKMVKSGLAKVEGKFEYPRTLTEREEIVSIGMDISEIIKQDLSEEEEELIKFVLKEGTVSVAELLENFKRRTVERLMKIGIISKATMRKNITLRDDQQRALRSIKSGVNILFGDTGSGKTEVFIEYLKGKKSLVLVPEVSLIPQLRRRFLQRVPDMNIGVYHSYLSKARKMKWWIESVLGKSDILIGTRSAAFVPAIWNVIVADEEHDESYFQRDGVVYDGIEVLKILSKEYQLPLILSSATPRIEDYYKAKSGEYNFIRISRKHTPPRINIIDMRDERGWFSKETLRKIGENLKNGNGIMIFVRRKGYGRVKCPRCGYVVKCDRCDTAMTFHIDSKTFKCHICGKEVEAFDRCPRCGAMLKIFGMGSEKAERILKRLFPEAKLRRADRESISSPDRFIETLDMVEKGSVDILVGTKMIVKGIDIDRIRLVVIMDIDGLMAIPDYTARLKAFQITHQAAGRSGRASKGDVIVQHWGMDPEFLEYIKKGDVEGFYEDELKRRKELNYPPFSDIVHVLYSSRDEKLAWEMAESVASIVKTGEVLGPSKYSVSKIKGKHTYHFIVKTSDLTSTLEEIFSEISVKDRRNWKVIPNPVSLI